MSSPAAVLYWWWWAGAAGGGGPAAPTNLEAALVAGPEVDLSWDAVAGADSYILERQVGAGAWAELSTPAGTSDTDAGPFTAGVRYRYRVRAVDGGDESAPSNEVALTPVPATAAGGIPHMLLGMRLGY